MPDLIFGHEYEEKTRALAWGTMDQILFCFFFRKAITY